MGKVDTINCVRSRVGHLARKRDNSLLGSSNHERRNVEPMGYTIPVQISEGIELSKAEFREPLWSKQVGRWVESEVRGGDGGYTLQREPQTHARSAAHVQHPLPWSIKPKKVTVLP